MTETRTAEPRARRLYLSNLTVPTALSRSEHAPTFHHNSSMGHLLCLNEYESVLREGVRNGARLQVLVNPDRNGTPADGVVPRNLAVKDSAEAARRSAEGASSGVASYRISIGVSPSLQAGKGFVSVRHLCDERSRHLVFALRSGT